MIATLEGKLAELSPPTIVIDCGGVGYELTMAISSIGKLPPIGSKVRIYTHLVVREDAHSLYGFLGQGERKLFQLLVRISGIGPKSAINLLSALDGAELARAVEGNDVKMLTAVPGIGKKNAERIIIELRDSKHLDAGAPLAPLMAQAVEALLALGYKRAAALKAVSAIDTSGKEVAEVIKLALAELAGR